VGEEELWYDDRIFRFDDLVSSGEGRRIPEPSSAGDDSDLALLYTSGMMGKPKGVRLSHRAIVETAVLTGDAIALSAADCVLVALPLFTIFGFGVVAGAVAVGATLVLQEEVDAREDSGPSEPSG
jgi:fatty-acyl-CoA synthase